MSMTYSVQLKSGRIELPETVLSSLSLNDGDTVVLEEDPTHGTFQIRNQSQVRPSRIYENRGVLVYRSLDADPTYDLLQSIDEMREERMRQVMGWSRNTKDEE